MMLRNLATALLAIGMTINLSMGSSGDRVTVAPDEASSIRGGAVAGACYNRGTPFGVCYSNQTCDPTVVPPVSGIINYSNLGGATNACYAAAVNKYVYCPCGNTLYGPFTGTATSSCYNATGD
jgi:hypothetical protein